LTPSTLGPVPLPGIGLDLLQPSLLAGAQKASRCMRIGRLVFRIRQRGRQPLRSAEIYIGGRRVKTVKGRAVTAPITLTRLPHGTFTLTVVSLTARGRKLTTRHRYLNCEPPPPCPRRRGLKLRIAQPSGSSSTHAYAGCRKR
jgi:hypothetical protein